MSEGDIGSVIDTLVFFSGDIQFSDIVHVSGDIYAIVYAGVEADGFIVTMNIRPNKRMGLKYRLNIIFTTFIVLINITIL